MRTRALALGISPHPFEGPWVNVRDGRTWEIRPKTPLSSHVRIESIGNDGDLRTEWDWEDPHIHEASLARVVVDEEYEGDLIFINAIATEI